MKKINLPKGEKKRVIDVISEEPKKKKNTDWRLKPGKSDIITAIIEGKLISIDLKTNEILFQNNFKIKCKSIEEAKEKAKDFFLDK